MRRVREPELMDEPGADAVELGRSLADLKRVNRWLGGRASTVRLVVGMAGGLGEREVRVLDLGTGGADLPLAVVGAARERGLRIRVTATDLHPRTVAFARAATRHAREIEVQEADMLGLPFEDGSHDIVMCSTALHHFDEADAGRALREMARVARHGVVVTDLARSLPAYIGACVLAGTVWRAHPITRHDGPASVRAAFTRRELMALARSAVGDGFTVRSEPIFRLSLVIRKGSPAGPPVPEAAI